jgi:glycosyltransferase involved in cell wall biosynthesis
VTKTDVIIPARNEEMTLGRTIHTFARHPAIGNIIVVVDADTTDLTWEVADATNQVRWLLSGTNIRGKGQCVKYGLRHVQSRRVIFCDADLNDLAEEHITKLITHPDHNTMIIGVPDFPDLDTIPPRFAPTILWAWPWVSGERSMVADVARDVDLHGYLMETQLNDANHAAGNMVLLERLHGLVSPLDLNEQRLAEMNRDLTWGQEHGVIPK